jgi:integrase
MHMPITDGRENSPRSPWNKGKLIGSKPPLRTNNVWSIRTKLQIERRIRDLALVNLAIDSKLGDCDVVSLKVEDVAPQRVAIDRATVRQRKTGHSVRFELSEQTREAVDDYIRATRKKPGEFLFTKQCRETEEHALNKRHALDLALIWPQAHRAGRRWGKRMFARSSATTADAAADGGKSAHPNDIGCTLPKSRAWAWRYRINGYPAMSASRPCRITLDNEIR